MVKGQIEVSSSSVQSSALMDKRLAWIMAVASGLAVANLYYIQPMLADMGRSFGVSAGQIGVVATLGQIGYALGLLLIVPLGDNYDQRRLIVGMLGVVIIMLLLMAFSPTFGIAAMACLLLGLATVVPQLIVPYAASLAAEHERGQIVGTVMSGLLIGILLARTVSGWVSAHLGWRAMYLIAAGMMVLLAIAMRFLLPRDPAAKGSMSYGSLLRSLWGLLKSEPVLRDAAVFGATAFATFSAFWVSLAFYLEATYHYGSEVAGLFGLGGVAGALAATYVGRFADRRNPRHAVGLALVIILISFLIMWLAGQWLLGLIVGVVLLDLGTQSNQISNQARIYALNPLARSRLNTVYMVIYFIGGSLGSFLGTWAWSIAGWDGVCALASLLLVSSLVFYIVNGKRVREGRVEGIGIHKWIG